MGSKGDVARHGRTEVIGGTIKVPANERLTNRRRNCSDIGSYSIIRHLLSRYNLAIVIGKQYSPLVAKFRNQLDIRRNRCGKIKTIGR